MAPKKFYAVRKGYTTGIFYSWTECKKQVLGYKGSIFKSFPTLKEAEDFLKGNEISFKIESGVKINPNPKKTVKKYYAIRKGLKTGIFDTWEECKKNIMGYNGSIYRSFLTLQEAEDFMKGNELSEKMEAGVKIKEKRNSTYDRKYYAVKRGHKTGIFSTWEQCQKQVTGIRFPIYKSFYTLKEAQEYLKGTKEEKSTTPENAQNNVNSEIINVDETSNDNEVDNEIDNSENTNINENLDNIEIDSNLDNIETDIIDLDNTEDNNKLDNNSKNIESNIIDLDNAEDNEENTNNNMDVTENNTNISDVDIEMIPEIINDNVNDENQNKAIAYVDGSFNKMTKEYSYGAVIFYKNQGHHFLKKFNNPEMSKMRNVAGEIEGAKKAMNYCIENKIPEIDIYYDYIGIENWATGKWKTNKEGTIQYKNFVNSIKKSLKINFIKVKAHSNDKYNDLADRLAKKALNIRTDSVFNRKSSFNFKRNIYFDRLRKK